MKIEGLITNVISIGSPVRAQCENFGMILEHFWPNSATFVVGEPLCDLGIPSWALHNTFTWGNYMKVKWSIAYVTSVGFPDKAERDIFWVIFGVFWPIQPAFVVMEPLCGLRIPSWWALVQLHFGPLNGKNEWLVANVTSLGSPARAKHDIFGMILDIFWSIQANFVVRGEPLCDLGIPSWALISLCT